MELEAGDGRAALESAAAAFGLLAKHRPSLKALADVNATDPGSGDTLLLSLVGLGWAAPALFSASTYGDVGRRAPCLAPSTISGGQPGSDCHDQAQAAMLGSLTSLLCRALLQVQTGSPKAVAQLLLMPGLDVNASNVVTCQTPLMAAADRKQVSWK